MRLLILLCFFCCSLYANEPQNLVEVKGKILSIQKYQMIDQPSPLMQIILRNTHGTLVVELGPVWFFKMEGFSLSPSSEITVRGKLSEKNGQRTIEASEIQKGKVSLKLRDEHGTPLWFSWRNES